MSRSQRGKGAAPARGGWGQSGRQIGRLPGGSRQRRPLILVIVEGEATEKLYFEGCARDQRSASVSVEVITGRGDTDPENLVQQAKKARQRRADNDRWAEDGQVWCVCDTELPIPGEKLRRAMGLANGFKINMAVSNPAFEYWLCLHFQRTDAPCANGEQMVKKLKRHIPDYEKSLDVFAQVGPLIRAALENAEFLRAQADGAWEPRVNPSTGVDRLVRVILNEGELD